MMHGDFMQMPKGDYKIVLSFISAFKNIRLVLGFAYKLFSVIHKEGDIYVTKTIAKHLKEDLGIQISRTNTKISMSVNNAEVREGQTIITRKSLTIVSYI